MFTINKTININYLRPKKMKFNSSEELNGWKKHIKNTKESLNSNIIECYNNVFERYFKTNNKAYKENQLTYLNRISGFKNWYIIPIYAKVGNDIIAKIRIKVNYLDSAEKVEISDISHYRLGQVFELNIDGVKDFFINKIECNYGVYFYTLKGCSQKNIQVCFAESMLKRFE